MLSVAPAAAFYARGILSGSMEKESGGRFLPQLLTTGFFWGGWRDQALTVADGWVWLLAAAGVLTARPGVARRLLLGLCGGYLLYGVIFTYHIATHDYYHLPALILAALAAGAAITAIERTAGRRLGSRPVTIALVLVTLLTAGLWLRRSEWELRSRDGSADVLRYQRLGAMLQHSQHTVMLTYDYGSAARYHGHLGGPSWPSAGDLSASEMGAGAGAAETSAWSGSITSAEQRYRQFYQPEAPDYFLITDFESLEAQPGLEPFLEEHFARLSGDSHYRVYDLRHERPVTTPPR